jgi:hypothetical protein
MLKVEKLRRGGLDLLRNVFQNLTRVAFVQRVSETVLQRNVQGFCTLSYHGSAHGKVCHGRYVPRFNVTQVLQSGQASLILCCSDYLCSAVKAECQGKSIHNC